MPKLDITQSFVDTVKVESEASSTDFYDKKLVGLLLKGCQMVEKHFICATKIPRTVVASARLVMR